MSDKADLESNGQARKSLAADLFARLSLTQLTLAVLVVIFLWQWFDAHRMIAEMRSELAKKIAEMDGASRANALLIAQNQDTVRAMSVRVSTLEAYYDQAQNQRAALETLYNNLSISRDETALADVEQLLLIAGQQLQLSSNVKAALIAMEGADARLQRMNRPAFNILTRAIDLDMDRLRALPLVDVSGINQKINSMLLAVDDLPLVDRHPPSGNAVEQASVPVAKKTVWKSWMDAVWLEVKQLVRIENTGLKQIVLLPPSQEFFLRENLKMHLVSARLALLSRDEDSFRQELKTAQVWIARYFDVKSPEGARMLAELRKLSTASINIEMPDISGSLQAVRSYRLSHDQSGVQRVKKAGR